jgi:hypothetical protein
VGNTVPKGSANVFHFREILDRIVVWEWDADRDRVITSPNLPAVYGTATLARESDGMTLVHPHDVEAHEARVLRAVERGRGYRSSFRIRRPDTGAVVAIEERAEAIARAPGTPPTLIGFAFAVRGDFERANNVSTEIAPDVERYCDAMLTAYAGALRTRELTVERTGPGDWIRRATRELSLLGSMAAPTVSDARKVLARAHASIGAITAPTNGPAEVD